MNETFDANDPKRVVAQGYHQVAQAYARLEQAKEWPHMRWLRKLLTVLEPGSDVTYGA